jgi:hypothetical protein
VLILAEKHRLKAHGSTVVGVAQRCARGLPSMLHGTAQRREDASRKLYARGGYNGGGSLPWGYRTERTDGRMERKVGTAHAKTINAIAGAVIGGASVAEQAHRHELAAASLIRRLRKVSLKGWVTYHDEAVTVSDQPGPTGQCRVRWQE